jgi:hypothetical protein
MLVSTVLYSEFLARGAADIIVSVQSSNVVLMNATVSPNSKSVRAEFRHPRLGLGSRLLFFEAPSPSLSYNRTKLLIL